MHVIIYGKPQLGFPIKASLSIEQAYSLDKLLNDIRARRDPAAFNYERQHYGNWNHWLWEFHQAWSNSFVSVDTWIISACLSGVSIAIIVGVIAAYAAANAASSSRR